jgi:hypothetical protein
MPPFMAHQRVVSSPSLPLSTGCPSSWLLANAGLPKAMFPAFEKPGAGFDGAVAGALVMTAVFAGAVLKISPRNKNAASAKQSRTIRTNVVAGKSFSGGVAIPESTGAVETGRSPFFVPVMMNFGSSVEGACGAVIFWKQVGHSITVPLCDESHFMCWPHTGQANLNSLMAVRKTFHIQAAAAIRFLPNPDLCLACKSQSFDGRN